MVTIEDICKLAEEFEEAIPKTQPSGQSEFYGDKPISVSLEEAPVLRDYSPEEIARLKPFLKKALHKFEYMAGLCRGAANLLKAGGPDLVYHPRIGVHTFLIPINKEVSELNVMFGKRK